MAIEFRRMTRTETTKRANVFGANTVDVVEDEYEIKADTAGEICVILETQEHAKLAFIDREEN